MVIIETFNHFTLLFFINYYDKVTAGGRIKIIRRVAKYLTNGAITCKTRPFVIIIILIVTYM